MNHLLRKLFALVGLLASVSAFGQVIAGDSWQAAAVTPSSGGGLSAIAAYSLLSNNTSGSAVPTATQQLIIGTPSFTDTGIATQFTQSVAGYYQHILMNTSTATNASADYIVGGNLMTATTYYGDFGMNSSTFTGTGNFNLANAVYLYSNSGDLVIGTQTANALHFVVGSSTASDAVTVNTAAASTPWMLLPGTWFTGGNVSTNWPQFLVQPSGTTSSSWSANGTGLGVNAPTGFTGNLADFKLNGTSEAYITNVGGLVLAGGLSVGSSSQILASNGSAASPSISIYNANTTGLYWTNPGVGFSVAGSSVGTWTASNLGASTTISSSNGTGTLVLATTSNSGVVNSSVTGSNLYFQVGSTTLETLANPVAGAGTSFTLGAGTFTGASVAQLGASLAYTINQTGTSSFTNLKLVTTETAKGTGNQRLIDAYAGASGTTSEFYVDDAGNQFTAGVVKHGGLTRTTAVFNATSSVTLTAITGLTTGTLTAGASYHFRASLPCTAAASGGVQFSIGGTATATAIQYQGILYSGGAIASQTAATALGTALNSSASAVTTGLEIIEGDIVVNAAGTLLPQFAQNTSNATSSTVTQGATFEVFQTSN